jgi:sugar O-acyltransferase (sialic acid O-acetyltransferase NeuD family)
MVKLGIFGTSGHARDIASIFQANKTVGVVTFIDQENEFEMVKKLRKKGFVFIIGVGDNRLRKKIAMRYTDLIWENVISTSAHISSDVRIGQGVFIGHGAYLSTNIQISDHVIIHCSSVIGHETVLEDFSQAAPGCCIGGGGVLVKEGVLLGANTTIINKPIEIGAWSMISLGSIITESVPSGVLYQALHKKITLKID